MASTTVKNFRTTPRRLDCAEVFFKCLETVAGDGYGTMTDAIRGAVYNPLTGNTGQYYNPETGEGAAGTPLANTFWMYQGNTVSNSVRPQNQVPTTLMAGSWPDLGQRKVILFACGVFRVTPDARIPFGDVSAVSPNGGNISVSCSPFHCIAKGPAGGNAVNAPTDAGLGLTCSSLIGQFVALVGEYTPATTDGVTVTNGAFRARVINAQGVTIASDQTTPLDITTPVLSVADITPNRNNGTRLGGLDFYGIRLFSFAAELPPEAVREAAYIWMMRHYAAGHREDPPHFTGYA